MIVYNRTEFGYAVFDGAKGIQRQCRLKLPMIDEHLLDWYHFKKYVVETGYAVYGEQTSQSGQWQQKMLDAAWNQGSLVMLHKLGAYERRHKGDKREMLLKLRNYVGPRITMTDYPSFKARGYDCGSGRQRANAAP